MLPPCAVNGEIIHNPMKLYRFKSAQKLHGKDAFALVYQNGKRKSCGPVLVVATPNGLKFNRMGLSVSRKVGNAVMRGKIKRLLREAFRLTQHDVPGGYDLILVPRPHDFLKLEDYQNIIKQTVPNLHHRWEKYPDPPPNKPTQQQ